MTRDNKSRLDVIDKAKVDRTNIKAKVMFGIVHIKRGKKADTKAIASIEINIDNTNKIID